MKFKYSLDGNQWGCHLSKYKNPFASLWMRLPDELTMYVPMKFLRYLQEEGYL